MKIPEHIIEKARNIDLPGYLMQAGYDLQKDGRSFRITGHGGLIVSKIASGKWLWYSHTQGEGGDSISLLRFLGEKSFPEAVMALTGFNNVRLPIAISDSSPQAGDETKKKVFDPVIFQKTLQLFVEDSQRKLFKDENRPLLDNLINDRGLNIPAIRQAGLGLHPQEEYVQREQFGYIYETYKKLWLPRAYVIPLFKGTELVSMRLKLIEPLAGKDGGKRKYHTLPGSSTPPLYFNIKRKRPIIIVESYLDGILLNQVSNGFCGVVALGSAGVKVEKFLTEEIKTSPLILISLDNDDAGQKAAKRLFPQLSNAKEWPLPASWGKDPGEARNKNLSLWLMTGFGATNCWECEYGLSPPTELLPMCRLEKKAANPDLGCIFD